MEWAVHLLLFGSGLALGVAVASVLWGRTLERVHREYRDLLADRALGRTAIARRLAALSAEPWGLDRLAAMRKDPPAPDPDDPFKKGL